MTLPGPALVVLFSLAGILDLEPLRALLLHAPAGERERVIAEVADRLQPADLPDALRAVQDWSPAAALSLRQAVLRAPVLRAPLLRAACEGPQPTAARRMLAELYRRSVARRSPWTVSGRAWRERVDLMPAGLRLESGLPPDRNPPFEEFLATLSEGGMLRAPLIVWPGLWNGEVAPLDTPARSLPAEWLLRRELRRRGWDCVRLVQALWVLPVAELAVVDGALPPREVAVFQELRAREERLLLRALQRLGELDPWTRALDAAPLFYALGLGSTGPTPGAVPEPWAQVLAWEAARHGIEMGALPVPSDPSRDRARRRYARALLATGEDLPDAPDPRLREALAWVSARRDPQGAEREALAWLSQGTGPAPANVLPGLRAALAEDPAAWRRRVAEGHLPYARGAWRGAGDPSDPCPGVADTDRADAGMRCAALRTHLGVPRTATGPAASAAASLAAGEAVDPAGILALLGSGPAIRCALQEVVAVDGDPAQVLAWLRARLADPPVAGEELRRQLEPLLHMVAELADRDPLLDGRSRESLQVAARAAEDAGDLERLAVLGDAARELWDLGYREPGAVLVDLLPVGWPP